VGRDGPQGPCPLFGDKSDDAELVVLYLMCNVSINAAYSSLIRAPISHNLLHEATDQSDWNSRTRIVSNSKVIGTPPGVQRRFFPGVFRTKSNGTPPQCSFLKG